MSTTASLPISHRSGLTLAMLALAGWVAHPSSSAAAEPTHDGHGMSYWVRQTDYTPFIDLNMHGEGGFAQRDKAFRALAAIGAPAVPALCQIAENKKLKWDRRWRAVESLGEIGPPAKSAHPVLVRVLNDPTFPVHNRYSAVMAIGKVKAGGICAGDLAKYLKRRHEEVPLSESSASDLDQTTAIGVLGEAGEPAKLAVPLLVEMLHHYQQALRDPKAGALPTKPEELKWATEAREMMRRSLIEALGRLAAFDPNALPAILESREDPSAEVRLHLAAALVKPAPQAALPLIDALAKGAEPAVRREVVETIASLATAQPEKCLAWLTRLLADADEEVRVRAADALGEMGAAARSASSQLDALAKDKSERVREHAADALKQIEGKSQRR